jgi:DNA-directed RNA polymerase specialized sigma24 family protein
MDEQEEPSGDAEPEAPAEQDESGPPHRGRRRRRGERAGPAALRGFAEEERRLILGTVNRFWRRWGGAFTAAAPEDMLGEAVLAVQEGRERAAARGRPATAGLAAVAIYRRLLKRKGDEYRARLRHAVGQQVELDEGRLRALEEGRDAEWSTLASDTLAPEDERIAAALATLDPLDRRIVDLKFMEDLTHAQITARLNGAPGKRSRRCELTTAAVARRFERAMRKLKEELGVETRE